MSSKKIWQKYEDVTRQLLLDIKDFIGLSKVESKQIIQGNSGTEWEIDVVAYDNITSKIILVECKHRTNSSLPQSLVGGAGLYNQRYKCREGNPCNNNWTSRRSRKGR
ncbi:MAG: DUF234 domain-containing protein [Cyanobacteriota bacterium]|nr:DUF234 domain-containing protein [Cyanobacteriota bacterium]